MKSHAERMEAYCSKNPKRAAKLAKLQAMSAKQTALAAEIEEANAFPQSVIVEVAFTAGGIQKKIAARRSTQSCSSTTTSESILPSKHGRR
jgi:hypothetical protein